MSPSRRCDSRAVASARLALARGLCVIALLAVPAVALAQARKTLEECIEIALRQQPTLRAAAATVAAGRERVWETAAAYLPQVSASYLASRRHGSPSSVIGSGGLREGKNFPFYPSRARPPQGGFGLGHDPALLPSAA